VLPAGAWMAQRWSRWQRGYAVYWFNLKLHARWGVLRCNAWSVNFPGNRWLIRPGLWVRLSRRI